MHERDRSSADRLIAVAHGTASPTGVATTERMVEALRERRPNVPVELCFLDVASPRLPDVLAGLPAGASAVVVPVLLSTGFHVQSDIPAAVAARPGVALARHLGPHPLLVDALLDRLPADDARTETRTVLVGAGSTRSEARAELEATAALLGERLGAPVDVLTMTDDLGTELRGRAGPVRVATYLLAEGRFTDTLARAATGVAAVAAPIGVHPALLELVWARYDETRHAGPLDFPGTAR